MVRITVNGQRSRPRYAKTKKEARKLRTEMYREAGVNPAAFYLHPDRNMTVNDLFELWKGRLAERVEVGDIGAKHAEDSMALLRVHVMPVIGAAKVIDVTAAHRDRVVASMIRTKKSSNTQRLTIGALRAMLKYAAVELKIFDLTTLTTIRRPHAERTKEPAMLTQAQRRELMDALAESDSPYAVPALLMAYTGARRSEVLATRREDLALNRDNPVWNVRASVTELRNGELVIGDPKTEKSRREVPLPDELVMILRRKFLAAGPTIYIGESSAAPGQPLRPSLFGRFLRKVYKDLGLPGGSHAARHGLAFGVVDALVADGRELNEAELLDLSRSLGHSRVSTTVDLYVRSDTSRMRRMLNAAVPPKKEAAG